jgi:hypothetical protein
MAAFQFYLQSGKQRKVGWVVTTVIMFLVKIPLWKRKCVKVRCSDATASSFVAKVWGEVFAHFHAFAVKRQISMRNWLSGLPRRVLYEQSPWCKRKWLTRSWLCSSSASPSLVSASSDFMCTADAFFPQRLSNHCQGIRGTFSEICTKFDGVPLSDPSRNRIRRGTRLQIKGRKNQHVHPAAWNCVPWLPRYTNTIIYRCIVLLQLLHRWQNQSRKLWISLVHHKNIHNHI